MPILEDEIARRDGARIEIRPTPLRVRWVLNDLIAADGHALRGEFSASVQALGDKANRRMLEEAFLGRLPVLSAEGVVTHFAPAMKAAAVKAAARRPAADWLEMTGGNDAGAARQELIDAIRSAGKAVAFSCGLELLPAFQLDLESPSYRRQKQEGLDRALAEQRAAGQVKHLERAAQLLQQFESLRQSAPQLSAGAVLEQISAADRGTMLQSLLMAAAQQAPTKHLWVAAGPYLVKVDVHSSPPQTELVPLPPTLGPLRSVRSAQLDGKPVLLVGARTGVMLVAPDAGATEPITFNDPSVTSPQGFSRAMIRHGALWACHGEAGVVRWPLGGASEPDFTLRPQQLAQAGQDKLPQVRHLAALDASRLVFSAGERLVTLAPDGTHAALPADVPSKIVALVPDERALYVVHEDGTIVTRDSSTLEVTSRQSRGMRIVSAGVLPWLGSRRLLLAGDSGAVQCVGFDDPLVTEYVSPHRAPALVTGAADYVAAVSADRQRIVLWTSWDGRRPVAEVPLAGVAKHRAADVDFA